MAMKLVCDLCDKALIPRGKDSPPWFARGGVVAVVVGGGYTRLVYGDRVLGEVCVECAGKCHARVYWSARYGQLS